MFSTMRTWAELHCEVNLYESQITCATLAITRSCHQVQRRLVLAWKMQRRSRLSCSVELCKSTPTEEELEANLESIH